MRRTPPENIQAAAIERLSLVLLVFGILVDAFRRPVRLDVVGGFDKWGGVAMFSASVIGVSVEVCSVGLVSGVEGGFVTELGVCSISAII